MPNIRKQLPIAHYYLDFVEEFGGNFNIVVASAKRSASYLPDIASSLKQEFPFSGPLIQVPKDGK